MEKHVFSKDGINITSAGVWCRLLIAEVSAPCDRSSITASVLACLTAMCSGLSPEISNTLYSINHLIEASRE